MQADRNLKPWSVTSIGHPMASPLDGSSQGRANLKQLLVINMQFLWQFIEYKMLKQEQAVLRAKVGTSWAHISGNHDISDERWQEPWAVEQVWNQQEKSSLYKQEQLNCSISEVDVRVFRKESTALARVVALRWQLQGQARAMRAFAEGLFSGISKSVS